MANSIASVTGPTTANMAAARTQVKTLNANPQYPFGSGLARQNTPGMDPVLAAVGINNIPDGMVPGNINAANPPAQNQM